MGSRDISPEWWCLHWDQNDKLELPRYVGEEGEKILDRRNSIVGGEGHLQGKEHTTAAAQDARGGAVLSHKASDMDRDKPV